VRRRPALPRVRPTQARSSRSCVSCSASTSSCPAASYIPEWASFEPAARLARAWELALGALHHAISYRSIVAQLQPPIDRHMAQSTAWWLRQVLAGLA
jgi:hypothetical protein